MGSVIKLLARMMFGVLNALRITTIQEEAFVLGKSFSYEDRITLPIGVTDIVFDPTAFTGVNLTVNPLIFSSDAGPVLIDIHTGVDADDNGTLLVASNRRETSSNTPESILRLSPTINDAGVKFAGDSVFASGLGVGNANEAGNMPTLPFEIDPTIKKMLRFTNGDGAGVTLQIKLTWLEL